LKPSSIEAGDEYSGGSVGYKRLVIVIFRSNDPKDATVKYVDKKYPDKVRYCSLDSFCRWAKRRTKKGRKTDDGLES